VLQQVFDIGTTAGVLVIVAMGLLLILGIMGVVNLAHGAFMTVGAYAAVVVTNWGWSPWSAFLVGPAAGFVLGVAVERLLVRRLYDRPLDTILATWGLAIVLIQFISGFFGRSSQFVDPPLDGDAIEVFGAFVSQYRLFCLGVALALAASILIVARTTNVGLVARAVIMDADLALALGINTSLVNSLCFGIGSAFAAFAGTCVAPLASVDPNLGTPWNITAFMVTLLGGISLPGMVISAFILSAAQMLAITYVAPVLASILVIVIPIVIMRFLPDGLASVNWSSLSGRRWIGRRGRP
jgi:branched-chain amino acid transport system permease protein